MTSPIRYPAGPWPCEMRADMAAAYVDEPSVEAFLRGVRAGVYPKPTERPHKRAKWLRDSLRRAAIVEAEGEDDLAELI